MKGAGAPAPASAGPGGFCIPQGPQEVGAVPISISHEKLRLCRGGWEGQAESQSQILVTQELSERPCCVTQCTGQGATQLGLPLGTKLTSRESNGAVDARSHGRCGENLGGFLVRLVLLSRACVGLGLSHSHLARPGHSSV